MALWKDSNPQTAPSASAESPQEPVSVAPAASPGFGPAGSTRGDRGESVIASGLTVEGKITGQGHVRIAGRFKGDVQVEGNVHVDAGARIEGLIRAVDVTVSGELIGNIDGARRVELRQGGMITGDVKAGALTVAAGARMRGQVDFGWDDSSP